MKILIYTLALLPLIIYQSLSVDFDPEFLPRKMEVDKNIMQKKLDLIERVKLDTDTFSPIDGINKLVFDGYCNQFVITDKAGSLYLFSYPDCKLRGFLQAGLYLSDSLVLSGIKPVEYYAQPDSLWEYLPMSDFEKLGVEKPGFGMLSNMFVIPQYTDEGSIYVTAHIYAYLKSVNDNYTSAGRPILMKFQGSLYFEKFIETDYIDDFLVKFSSFSFDEYNNQFLIGLSKNSFHHEESGIEFYDMLGRFTSDGKYIETVFLYPEHCKKAGVHFVTSYHFFLEKIMDEYIVAFPILHNIYGLYNKEKFKLYNLPYSSDEGVKYYEHYNEMFRGEINGKDYFRLFYLLFPVQIVNIFEGDGTYIVLTKVWGGDIYEPAYHILQEYNRDGKLISQNTISNDEKDILQYFYYDYYNNILLLIKKNPEGMYVEKRMWE